MTDGLQGKLIDGLVKGLVAVFSGGGLFTLSSSWVGKAAFDSFNAKHLADVSFPADPPPQLLEYWTRQVFARSLESIEGLWLIVLIAGLLALIAHVVARSSLDAEEESSSRGRWRIVYDHWHGAITLGVFLVLAVLLWQASSARALVFAFALLLGPGLFYLLLYAADLRRPTFVPRFSWIACALLVGVALFSAPRLYGSRFFLDEIFSKITVIRATDESAGAFAIRDADVRCIIQPNRWVQIQELGDWVAKGATERLIDVLDQPPLDKDPESATFEAESDALIDSAPPRVDSTGS